MVLVRCMRWARYRSGRAAIMTGGDANYVAGRNPYPRGWLAASACCAGP